LVINADDFGLCEGVNKGILEAHSDGVLTSATIMVNMSAAEQAAELAKKTPTLGVGVHLNLTEGTPVSDDDSVRPLLDSDGNFCLSAGKLALCSVSAKTRRAIETELAAQIQWLIDRAIKPTHLDSHKHIHSFPLIFSVVCRLARRFDIRAVRYAYESGAVSQIPFPLTDKDGRRRAQIVRAMAKVNRWQNSDFFRTDLLFGVAHTGKINANFLKAVALYDSAATAELMTHPGYTDGLDADRTRLVKERQVELEALCSEKTKQQFRNAGIELVHYGQL